MIEIILTYSDFKEAKAEKERLFKLHGNSAGSIKSIQDHDLIGALGEIAFQKYCEKIGLDCTPHPKETGWKGDKYDFIIKYNGKTYYFDVKSSGRYNTICVNENAYEKAVNLKNILVGVKIDIVNKTAKILGYSYPDQLERDYGKDFCYKGKHFKMYSIPFNKLKSFKIHNCIF